MALDLELWAQLNMVGHVGWLDYMAMTPDDAMACLRALESVINQSKKQSQRQAEFDQLVQRYQKN